MIEKIELSEALGALEASTGFTSVYGNGSSGTPARISKNNMASALMGVNQRTITSQDWNTITAPGLYAVLGMTGDNKPNSYNYGLLEVIAVGNIIIQRYYPDATTGNQVCYRTKYGSYEWRSWYYFAFTE